MQSVRHEIHTSHGVIAVEINGDRGPNVVFLHGNATSRQVFHRQTHDTFKNYRMISFDLPGHGESSDACDKNRTYSLSGLAEATMEMLELIDVKSAVLVGWSIGGHIAIEMLAKGFDAFGLFLTGAPPLGPEVEKGFRGDLITGLSGRGMGDEEATRFVQSVFGASGQPFMQRAARRADEGFRSPVLAERRLQEKGSGRDIVSKLQIKTAVVNGRDDCIVDLDYLDAVPFSRLWRDTCFRIPGAGHAPFLEAPIAFNALLSAFLAEVAWDVCHLDPASA